MPVHVRDLGRARIRGELADRVLGVPGAVERVGAVVLHHHWGREGCRAYREVTMLEVKEVLRFWLGGVRKKRIASQLGLNIKMVRRYLRAGSLRGTAPVLDPTILFRSNWNAHY